MFELMDRNALTMTREDILSVFRKFVIVFRRKKCRNIATVAKRENTIETYDTNRRTGKFFLIERTDILFFIESFKRITSSHIGNFQSEIIFTDFALFRMKSNIARSNSINTISNSCFC